MLASSDAVPRSAPARPRARRNLPRRERPLARAAGVPHTVKGLSLVSLFNDFASEMVYPLLPALRDRARSAGVPLVLGLLDGAADLTSAVLKVVSGRLADRPGWRGPLILVGYATAVLVRPLIAVAGAAWQVVGFRVIDRVGKGIRTPAARCARSPRSRRPSFAAARSASTAPPTTSARCSARSRRGTSCRAGLGRAEA